VWTEEQRARHAPRGRRYPSDLTDAEWALIAPFIPPPRSRGRGRKTDMHKVMNAILYVLATAVTFIKLAMIRIMRCRLASPSITA